MPLLNVERLDELPLAAHDWQIIVDASSGAYQSPMDDAPLPDDQDDGTSIGGMTRPVAAGTPASPLHRSSEPTDRELETARALSGQLLSSCAGSSANSLAGEVSFPASIDGSPGRDVSNAKRAQSPTLPRLKRPNPASRQCSTTAGLPRRVREAITAYRLTQAMRWPTSSSRTLSRFSFSVERGGNLASPVQFTTVVAAVRSPISELSVL